MQNQLFAVEKYETGSDRSVPLPELPLTGRSRLVTLVRLADDDVVLALVEGPDAETVTASMTAAGWRVDRVSPASWLLPPIPLASGPHRDATPEVLK